jgi:uncharacterized protein (TIGR03083 family)
VAEIVRTRASEPIPPPDQEWSDDEAVTRLEAGVAGLLTVLGDVDPDEKVWNWSEGEQRAGFWYRRMAQETAVHRWDGQAAHSMEQPVDPELATDGIDEMLEVMLPRLGPLDGLEGSVHIHCTDTQGEWLLAAEDGRPVVERLHKKGDVAVRGSASDLLLLLWGRVPPEAVEVLGDLSVLTRWRERTRVQ